MISIKFKASDMAEKLFNTYGKSDEEIAFTIGVSSMSVYRWRKQKMEPKSRFVRMQLHQLLKECEKEHSSLQLI